MKHFLRFGSHQENKVFINSWVKNQVQGLAFNANVIAHTPTAIHKFININFPNTSYFIDPQTYMFQLDPIKYYSSAEKNTHKKVLKKSVETLVNEYGEPAKSIANTLEPLTNQDFEKSLENFTENVINFQLNYLQEEYNKRESEGYEDYDDNDSRISPQYIIPPYFYLTFEDFKPWLELNKKAYEIAIDNHSPKLNLLPQLVFEKHVLLDDSKIKQIIDYYNNIECDTILLWIDDFNENDVSYEYINAFVNFLKKLNKSVINLYGGHFSLLLCKEQYLEGFCHGPGYGEHRPVKPVGGGIPNAKFYLPFTAKRENFPQAYSVLSLKHLLSGDNNHYYKHVCDCNKCKEILGTNPTADKFAAFGEYEPSRKTGREIPTQETLYNNHIHFVLKRLSDLKDVTIEKEIKKFKDFIQWNKEHKEVSVSHLENWIKILDNNGK